ncbi:MAG: peptide chain release factor N(5)-glutamine methyltransferase [Oceanospirillales bacterium]|nr:MAG: peptide chain release factor N(5)-glutamine methyltransferase [Oceanospirillales bacterium]
MRIDQALALSQSLEKYSDSARLDVELLLCHVLDKPRSYLYTWPEVELTELQLTTFQELITRRQAGEPVAHLTGKRGFWTLDLNVSRDTLIPRPETEMLVEWVLQQFPSEYSNHPLRLADLGTGTGAIALAIASERPAWLIEATDIQPGAVELAQLNAKQLGLNQVKVMQGSWCEPLTGHYDLLVSNPPYIDPEHPCLQEGDLRYEPLTALIAGQQGLQDILIIISQSIAFLKEGGWLVFEHGYDQGQAVREALKKSGFYQCFTQQDLNGHDRITGGCYGKQ